MKKLCALILVGMFFIGCAGNQYSSQEVPVPEVSDYRTGTEQKKFDNATLDFGEELKLKESVKLALSQSPQIGMQERQVQARQASLKESRGKRLPNLSVKSSANHYLNEQPLAGGSSPGDPGTWSDDQVGADLVLELPLFTGGGLIHRVSAARLLHKSSRRTLGRTRKEVVFNITSTFYAILKQRRVVESLRFSRRAVEQQKQDIEALIKNEKGIKADLLRVKVRLADLEQQIITANNRLDALNRLLANQMGIKTREDRLPVQGELSFDSADPDDDVSLQDAYSQRNDYQALKTRVVAARKSLAASRAEYWPNVELQSSYGGRWAVGDSTQQPGASDSADVGSIGVYLKLPLFTGGEISAGVAKKQAELSSLEERLRDLKLRIRREVQDSADSVRSAREKVQMTRTAIDAAKEALNIKKAKYNLGKTTISEFLDSQADLLGAQTDLARALGEYNTARARLELAKGTILQGIKK